MIVVMAFLRAQSNLIGICNLPLFHSISFSIADSCLFKKFTMISFRNTKSPNQSAPTILIYQVDLKFFYGLDLLKNQGPCFLQKAGCKKNRVIVIQKEKRPGCLFSF
jgi:hypothetical protein